MLNRNFSFWFIWFLTLLSYFPFLSMLHYFLKSIFQFISSLSSCIYTIFNPYRYLNSMIIKLNDYFSSFKSHWSLFLSLFLRLHPWHMEVLRLGVKSELQLPAYTTATAMPGPQSTEWGQGSNPNLMVPSWACFCCTMMGIWDNEVLFQSHLSPPLKK